MGIDTDNKRISVGANIAWNAFGSVVYMGCQWLMTLVVVWLSAGFDDAGVFALAMAMGNVFVPIAQYRMRTYQVSDVLRKNTTGDYLGFRLVTVSAGFLIVGAYSAATNGLDSLAVVLAYLMYKAVELIIDVLHGLDQIEMRMDYIGKSLFIRGVLSLIGFVAGITCFSSLFASVILMTVLCAMFGLIYDVRASKRFDSLRPKLDSRTAWLLLRECALPVVSLLACSASMAIPRQYLSIACGQEVLGIYASVAAPIALIQSGAAYIYSPLLGVFAKHYTNGDTRSFAKLLSLVSLVMLAAVLVLGGAMQLVGPSALSLLYGKGMGQYSYLFFPMILCAIATAYLWFLNDLLLVMRRNLQNAVCNVVGIALAVLTTIPLVNSFEMNGVSFTGIASYGVAAALSAICILTTLKRQSLVKSRS